MEWNSKDKLALRVLDYYAQQENGQQQIFHTQAVANYTRLISAGEGWNDNKISLQEMAAWLHDIGCPTARRIHGSTLPKYQQKEGKIIASLWMKNTPDLTLPERNWLVDVVASHHQYNHATALGFVPLFEADLIVNLLEGYYPIDQAPTLYNTLMTTTTGRHIFSLFFPISEAGKDETKE